jgi:rhodanese-related sulfurtransferase
VRSIEQFVESHIPGALHIPVSRVQGEIPYLPKDKPIVAYCTCPAEESSGAAALILAHGDIEAFALTGGLEAWTRAGYPTASGVQ